jgi:hypothetical protein
MQRCGDGEFERLRGREVERGGGEVVGVGCRCRCRGGGAGAAEVQVLRWRGGEVQRYRARCKTRCKARFRARYRARC